MHSEQRFHYMAAKGEVRVDQAHRGYNIVEDETGKADVSVFLYISLLLLPSPSFGGGKSFG